MHPVVSSCFLLFLFFRFSGYLKSPKNSGKIILKISVTEPSGIIKKGRGATTRQPGGLVARPPPGPRRAPSWLPRGSPRRPLRLYLPLRVETPNREPFFPEAIPISAAIAIKFRGTRIPVPAPCRDGEVPPDSSPSTLLPFSMKRE